MHESAKPESRLRDAGVSDEANPEAPAGCRAEKATPSDRASDAVAGLAPDHAAQRAQAISGESAAQAVESDGFRRLPIDEHCIARLIQSGRIPMAAVDSDRSLGEAISRFLTCLGEADEYSRLVDQMMERAAAAARGKGTLDAASLGGRTKAERQRQELDERNRWLAVQYLQQHPGSRLSKSALKESIGAGAGLSRSAAIRAIDAGLRALNAAPEA